MKTVFMKIGILSDTHIPVAAKELPPEVIDILSKTDAIIHAGDYQNEDLIHELGAMTDFYGVSGNMDGHAVRTLVPEKRVVTLNRFKIGIIHGWGAPDGIEDRIRTEFQNDTPDVIVFGHSHRPANTMIDHTLFFNPGSPTDRRYAPFCSMGILHIDENVRGEIIKVST